MNVYFSTSLVLAALWALSGTNTQARLSRKRLLTDEDADIAAAARLWKPIRWLRRSSERRSLDVAEQRFRDDPVRWERYVDLCSELRAWNALESSVAIALPAAIAGLLSTLP
jgi:hypothetical protein